MEDCLFFFSEWKEWKDRQEHQQRHQHLQQQQQPCSEAKCRDVGQKQERALFKAKEGQQGGQAKTGVAKHCPWEETWPASSTLQRSQKEKPSSGLEQRQWL